MMQLHTTERITLEAAKARMAHAHSHLEYRRVMLGVAEGKDGRGLALYRALMWQAEANYLMALDLLWGVQSRVCP